MELYEKYMDFFNDGKEKGRAEEQKNTERERLRAEKAEQEIAKLRAELAALQK